MLFRSPAFFFEIPFLLQQQVSNEPVYYLEGHFGIRIENLLVVAPSARTTISKSPSVAKVPSKSFLQFERLTLIPIQVMA